MNHSIHFAHVDAGSFRQQEPAWETLVIFAKALHHVGLPSHVIEAKIHEVAKRMEIPMEVLAVPTGLMLSFCPQYHRPVTLITRESPAVLNLELLDEVVAIAKDFGSGDEDLSSIRSRLKTVFNKTPRWRDPQILLAYVLSSSAFALFFHGGLRELIVAMFVGLIVGLTAIWMRRIKYSSRLFELTAALAAAFLIYGCEPWVGGFEEWIPMAAGLIMLLPGVALVDAVNELASGHLLAGGARAAGVAVAFLALTFGTLVGVALADVLPGEHIAGHTTDHLPEWTTYAAVVIVSVGSVIRFRANPSSFMVVLMASAVSYVSSQTGRQVFGNIPGAFLAAITLGMLGNLYSHLCGHATELFTIPGLAVLVPGSVGIRSMRYFLENQTSTGIAEGLQMLLVAMALVSGLLFSNSIWQAIHNRRNKAELVQ